MVSVLVKFHLRGSMPVTAPLWLLLDATEKVGCFSVMKPKHQHAFIVFWEEWLVAGSELVNPEPSDRERVICNGETVIFSDTEINARRHFKEAFKYSEIVKIKTLLTGESNRLYQYGET